MILAVSASRAFAQVAPDAPTKQEMATGYRSKSGEGGTAFRGLRSERWRIKQVRGWSRLMDGGNGRERISYTHDSGFRATAHENLYRRE